MDISTVLKVTFTSQFPHRIDVLISACVCVLKSMKSGQTFHVEFRCQLDNETTEDESIGLTVVTSWSLVSL